MKIDVRPNCVQNFSLFLTQMAMPDRYKDQSVMLTDIITAYCQHHTKNKYALWQNAVS